MSIQNDLSRAQAARQRGDLAQAKSIYQQILAEQHHPEALHSLGQIAMRSQDYSQAIAYFGQILDVYPDNAGTLNNRAIAYFQQGQISLAQKDWERALDADPKQSSFWFNLGRCFQAYQTTHGHTQAKKCFQKAVALTPDYVQAWNSLGNVLAECGKTKKAIQAYQKALSYEPEQIDTQVNMAVSYVEIHKRKTAYRLLKQIAETVPAPANALYNLGILDLQSGLMQAGLERYEKYRWVGNDFIRPKGNLDLPLWDGQAVDKLLICHEQGFGDTIQFSRYLAYASRLTQHLYLEVPPPLVPLMEGLSLDLDCPLTVIAEGDVLPEVDVWAPILRLLYVFSEQLFAQNFIPYFKIDRAVLPESARRKVGIVWATGYRESPRLKKLYHRKSVDISLIEDLVRAHPDVDFYSFQVGQEEQAQPQGVLPLPVELKSFADTAAYLQDMDLLISADTAVAHLAGALAMPVWVLIPSVADWRWEYEGDQTPWYPENMKLFRQKPEDEDWSKVFQAVHHSLSEMKMLEATSI